MSAMRIGTPELSERLIQIAAICNSLIFYLDKAIFLFYTLVKYLTNYIVRFYMNRKEINIYVNQYCHLRDVQYAAYTKWARLHNLTTNELFVLDLIWFAPEGCSQSYICERMSATKQTISAIVKKFLKSGYVTLTEDINDRRNKIIHFTDAGYEYTKKIIPPAAKAENDAMAELAKEENIAELVRLTTLFSNLMKQKFDDIK